ncbi:MAG: diphthamide biosynthesis enzyme Dph2 [Candidatus Anstonellaceae archaeon]
MRIMIQFPEGLKQKAAEEAEKLELQGHEVFVASAPCYGACDICLDEARHVKAEKIIHFGHAEFMKVKADIEIEYRPYFSELDWKATNKVLEKAVKLLRGIDAKKIAFVYPVQHLENSKRAVKYFEDAGLEIKMGMGGGHVRHPGQILGCDSEAAPNAGNVDAVVYFGGGKFHPLGISSAKPVLCADPHLGDSYWITDEIKKIERKRNGSILAATKANVFGILISTKCGQINMTGARMAKKLLEKKGKKAMLLVANELNPISLANFLTFDAYINTACPRINDDTEAYGKPIVNVQDLKRLLELMV